MPALADIGKGFSARFRAVVDQYRQAQAQAQAIRSSPDRRLRTLAAHTEKEVQSGMSRLDNVARNLYQLNQDFSRIPKPLGPVKDAALWAVVPTLDATLKSLEDHSSSLVDGRLARSRFFPTAMGAVTEAEFYPEEEGFDWYNPVDVFRAAKYELAKTLEQIRAAGVVAGTTLTDAALAAQKAALQAATETASAAYSGVKKPASDLYWTAVKTGAVIVGGGAAIWLLHSYIKTKARKRT